ncbi:MAG: hypothetical protein U0X41_10945 [Chitinophagales bacterium]
MRKDFIFILVILLSIISGCNKDKHRIATPVYQLDSVRIELNSNYFCTILINSEYVDSILNLRIDVDRGIEDEFRKSNNGDTLYYFGNSQVGFSNTTATFIDSRYFRSNFDLGNQYGQNWADVWYNYSTAGRLDSFYMESRIGYEAYTVILNESNNILDYSNGNISKIYCMDKYRSDYVYVDANLNYIDTTIQKNDIVSFSYTSSENQKPIIGVDLNDIIMNAFLKAYSYFNLPGYSYGLLNYPILEQALLLNNTISYHTDCSHLINNIQFTKPQKSVDYGVDSFIYNTTNLHADYTFNSLKDNRIQTMTISLLQNNPEYTNNIKYTFYYKN